MGLDTTHDCWHGPYSSFMRWREEVARAVGVPLGLMEGFCRHGPEGSAPEALTDWLPVRWESLKPDPIHILLTHSDCDGEIAVEDCTPLAERLEELARELPEEPKWHRGESARAKALQFARGLREAAAAGEPVEFG